MRYTAFALGVAVLLLSGPALAQEEPIPKGVQGAWAAAGKCSGQTVTFTAHALQYKGSKPQPAYFAPKESPRGYGAIHYVEEGNVDNFEYAADKKQLFYNPEGFGMGKSVLFKRCP